MKIQINAAARLRAATALTERKNLESVRDEQRRLKEKMGVAHASLRSKGRSA